MLRSPLRLRTRLRSPCRRLSPHVRPGARGGGDRQATRSGRRQVANAYGSRGHREDSPGYRSGAEDRHPLPGRRSLRCSGTLGRCGARDANRLTGSGREEAAGVHPLEVLRQHLRERTFLLVLDNFEHVAEAAPEVVGLLGSCPNLCVLATSRAPLRVRGEREYPVSPLAVPDHSRTPEAEEVARTPAAKLFVERTQNVSPAFELTQANGGGGGDLLEVGWAAPRAGAGGGEDEVAGADGFAL